MVDKASQIITRLATYVSGRDPHRRCSPSHPPPGPALPERAASAVGRPGSTDVRQPSLGRGHVLPVLRARTLYEGDPLVDEARPSADHRLPCAHRQGRCILPGSVLPGQSMAESTAGRDAPYITQCQLTRLALVCARHLKGAASTPPGSLCVCVSVRLPLGWRERDLGLFEPCNSTVKIKSGPYGGRRDGPSAASDSRATIGSALYE
jgi:hypothetical protein